MNITPDQIIQILTPNTLADFLLYGIIILAFLLTMLIPSGNDLPSYITFGVIFMAVFDLLREGVQGFIPGTENDGLVTFGIHVALALLPFVVVGMVRRKKSSAAAIGRARAVAFLLGMLGTILLVGGFLDATSGLLRGVFY